MPWRVAVATGFSFRLEESDRGIGFCSWHGALCWLAKAGITAPEVRGADIMVLGLGESAVLPALQLAQTLRGEFAGLRVKADFSARSMKAQMRGANRARAQVALILGEDELAQGTVVCKMMENSEQETIAINELNGFLAAKLKVC